MLTQHIRLALRKFNRSRVDFFINIVGLTAGLAAFTLIYLWVNDELLFDKFLDAHGRLYQVMEHWQQPDELRTHGNTVDYLASALAAEMPQINHAVTITPDNFFPQFALVNGLHLAKGNGRFVDPAFFEVFQFPLIQGNASNVLHDRSAIVISASLARKLFGSEIDVVGKALTWDVMNIRKDVVVTGVFNDVPSNTSLQFDFVLPFDSFRDIMGMSTSGTDWNNTAPFETYVVLRHDASKSATEISLNAFLKSRADNAAQRQLFLKPYSEKYLRGEYTNGVLSGGRMDYVVLLSMVGGFILLIACINFVNLYTARALSRLRQIGIRKAIGAERSTLVAQYLTESFLLVGIAAVISLAIVVLLLPAFNQLTGKHIVLAPDVRTIVVYGAILILTSLLAGGYPAMYLSGFDAVKTIKGETTLFADRGFLRKGLSVFQFTLSIIFVTAVLVSQKQMTFIQNRDLGYDRDNVVYFPAEGKLSQDVQSFLTEIRKVDGVRQASSMLGNIINPSDGGGQVMQLNGKTAVLHNVAVNYGWTELLELEMREGRAFSPLHATDADKIICNEAAVVALGLVDPVGKKIAGKEILGIVKDFHFQSLRQQIEPLMIRLEPQAVTTVIVRITGGAERTTLEKVGQLWKDMNPGYVFDYHFLDENFEAQYVAEKRMGVLAQSAAVVAMVITCLGLFGLSTFLIERRGREVSIRKILGSSTTRILALLSSEFVKIIATSVVIALPVSSFLASQWLSQYAFRTEFGVWYLLIAPGIMILITIVTLLVQTVNAATRNPLERLRSE